MHQTVYKTLAKNENIILKETLLKLTILASFKKQPDENPPVGFVATPSAPQLWFQTPDCTDSPFPQDPSSPKQPSGPPRGATLEGCPGMAKLVTDNQTGHWCSS